MNGERWENKMAQLIGRILFATDFSDCAAGAEAYAVFLAQAYGADVDVLHVLEFYPGMNPDYPVNALYLDQLKQEADRQLEMVANRIGQSGIAVKSQQMLGIPSQQICSVAREYQSDLIVLGTYGRTGLEHVLLGSTAERVIATAPCPVFTLRAAQSTGRTPLQAAQSPIALQHILVAVDFSDCSLEALEYAIQLAKQFGAPMTILHVLEPVTYGLDFTLVHAGERKKMRERIESQLSVFVTAVESQGLPARYAIRGGTPADSILSSLQEAKADLIVMGTHGRRGLSHVLKGSVAEAVLRRAPCPVLTVKSPKFSPGYQRLIVRGGAHAIA